MKTYKTLSQEEYKVLIKIANKTKMNCWFFIKQDKNGTDYVFDLEERKKLCLKSGISLLVEGLDCSENYDNCNLTNEEKQTFEELLIKLNINFKLKETTKKTYKYYLEICDRQNHVLMETKYFDKFVEVVNFYNEYVDYVDKGQCRVYIMQQEYFADADEYGDSNIIDVFE